MNILIRLIEYTDRALGAITLRFNVEKKKDIFHNDKDIFKCRSIMPILVISYLVGIMIWSMFSGDILWGAVLGTISPFFILSGLLFRQVDILVIGIFSFMSVGMISGIFIKSEMSGALGKWAGYLGGIIIGAFWIALNISAIKFISSVRF